MSKDISVAADQPAITTRPKEGEPVTSDQFSMDFDVEVDTDGCYVVEFLLKERRSGPIADDIILANANAYVAPFCFPVGTLKQHFRVTTSVPAPPGSTLPPAPPAGTLTLPPVDGKWPEHSSAEFYYNIEVYYIGPCSGGGCAQVQRSTLTSATPYMTVEGPNSGGTDPELRPIERELLSLRLPDGGDGSTLLAAVPRPPMRDLCSGPGPVVRVAGLKVAFDLAYARNHDTFDESGVIATRYVRVGEVWQPTLRMALRDLHPSLDHLGKALLRVEAFESNKDYAGGLVARSGIVRHGRFTLLDKVGAPSFSTYFADDRGTLILYPGLGPVLLGVPGGGVPLPAASSPPPEEEEVTVFMREDLDEHWFSFLSDGFEFINPFNKYISGINTLISDVLDPVISSPTPTCIKTLRILSHGGPLHARSGTGTVIGSFIRMGADDLASWDFDTTGTPLPGTQTLALLDKLKRAVCPNGKIVFSACGQGVDNLLQNISTYIDNGIIVNGFSDIGQPFTDGDMNYKDGVQQG